MRRLLSLLSLAVLMLTASIGVATVINVPVDQPTIQQGVNAAAPGDTVMVAPGIYGESVLLYASPLTVCSSGGPTMTIIDALSFSQGFLVYGSVDETTVLRGFTVQGANLAGVNCMSATAATIEDMVFAHNDGPGIITTLAAPRISGCVFYSNESYGVEVDGGTPVLTDCDLHGEGIHIEGGAHVELKNCALNGSGTYIQRELRGSGARVYGSSLTVDGCTFSDYDGQSALALYSTGLIEINDSEFLRNTAGLGPAIYCEGNSSYDTPVVVNSTLFEDNASWENGGTIVLRWNKSATFTDCTWRSNTTGGYGGAVSTHDCATVTYNSCEFYGNHGHEGGAVRSYGPTRCDLYVDHCLFVDNTCGDRGGAIRTTDTGGMISNCTIYGGGAASYAGAIHCGGITAPDVVACIITGGTGWGFSTSDLTSIPNTSYTDVYDMASGGYLYPVPDVTGINGNISADPLFCDTMAGDFSVYDLSPCATGGPSGGYIGAFDIGCTGTPVEPRSWGAIKAMYR